MKAVFIVFNQSLTEEVLEIMEECSIRGHTQWLGLRGRGSEKGEPHEGTHTWPELNNAYLTMVDDSIVAPLLEKLHKLNNEVEKQGLRAFTWNIESTV
jgi:nitrogen regulatory protein PII